MLVFSVLNVFCNPNFASLVSYTFAISFVPSAAAAFNAYVSTGWLPVNVISFSAPFTSFPINLLLLLTMYSTWSLAFGSHIAKLFIVAPFVASNISFWVAVASSIPLYNASPTLTVF